ncbi:MAG: aspartate aminotransferase family protein [Gammaproteobacteria bacterium]
MQLIPTYQPLPVAFERGEGVWLWDSQGKKYLDALGGIAVCCLGHAHPEVTEAICQQAGQLLHTSNLYQIDLQIALAQKLTQMSSMQQVFFSNSGAEANEAAIKLARLYGHAQGIDSPNVIVMEGAFHGRTMATLTASANRKVQAGFEPLVPGFIRVPYDDITALQNIAQNSDDVVAVLIEPIQGESGVRTPNADYLEKVSALCKQNNWLLMIDEIQSGMGRTGKFFAYQHHAVEPDVVTVAKGLANGVPIGACLIGGKAADLFQPGKHGSTFGGNPLACRAALTVVDIIEQQQLCQQAAARGEYLFAALRDALADNPMVQEIRGQGLMIGIELDRPCAELAKIGLEQGLLFSITAERVIRLLPALIIQQEEVDLIIERLLACLDEYAGHY